LARAPPSPHGRRFPRAGKRFAADPSIKILILATSTAGRGPGPLISAIAKEGVGFSGRKLPVTVVPGDLTDEEIEALA
jgi:hypothetical protein